MSRPPHVSARKAVFLAALCFAAFLQAACGTAPPLPQGERITTLGIIVKGESIAAVPQWMGRPEIVRAQTGVLTYALAQEMGRYYDYWISDSGGTEYKVSSTAEFAVGACVQFAAVWSHSTQRIWALGAAEMQKAIGCAATK